MKAVGVIVMDNVQTLAVALVLIAFLAQTLTETTKRLARRWIDRLEPTTAEDVKVWLALAFGFDVDVLKGISDLVGRPFAVPYVGIILAGFLAGQGSQWVNDWLSNLPQRIVSRGGRNTRIT